MIEDTSSTTLTSRLELFLHDRMSHLSAFVFSVFAGRWLMSFWTGTAKSMSSTQLPVVSMFAGSPSGR